MDHPRGASILKLALDLVGSFLKITHDSKSALSYNIGIEDDLVGIYSNYSTAKVRVEGVTSVNMCRERPAAPPQKKIKRTTCVQVRVKEVGSAAATY